MGVGFVLLVVIVVLWTLGQWKRSRFNEFAKKVGGPRGLPGIGMIHRLTSMREVLYILPTLTGGTKSAFMWLLNRPVFYTYDPEKIEKILTAPECINKSELYDIIDREVGSGILSSKTPIWDHHRKLMNHSFSHRVLLSFFPIFNEKSNDFLESLDDFVGKGESNIWDLLQVFSIQTSYATTIGDDVDRDVNKTFSEHINRYITTVFDRSLNPRLRSNLFFRFSKFYGAFQESKKTVREFVEALLKKKLAAAEQKERDLDNNNLAPKDSVNIVKSECILMDMFTESLRKNVLTWQEATNESYVVVAAAFETSATTLYSLLTLIAMHPHVQNKLYDEVLSVFPEEEFDVKYEDLQHLSYMDMVFDEALRVTPSVPMISRTTMKDVEIGEDLWMPKGTMVMVDIFNLHRSEELWGPNAGNFDPDHFLPGWQSGKHPYTYIPFSKGPRNCIGWRYARMFLKVALAKIIRKYRISTSFAFEDLRFVQHLSLRYDVRPNLEIHRR